MNQKITTYGGVLNNDTDIQFDFSYSGIEFQALEDITIEIKCILSDKLNHYRMKHFSYIYLEMTIDGKEIALIQIHYNESKTFKIQANQRVRFMKLSEAYFGIVSFTNLLSLPIQSVPKEEKVKVEFIGASLVCGYGNDHEDNAMNHTDWRKTWCYHLCQHYNWEPMVHAYSGMGLVKDSSGSREEQITERRRRIIGSYEESKFDFSTFKASYVIMNIGTNDFGGVVKEYRRIEFLEKMKQLIYELQENYGKNVKVIIVHGPMMNEPVRDVMREIPDLFNDDLETKKNVTVVSTYLSDKEEEIDLYWGPCWHPTVLGHKIMAEQIIEQLK